MSTTSRHKSNVLLVAAALLLNARTTIVRHLLVPAIALVLTITTHARPRSTAGSVSAAATTPPIPPPPAVHPLYGLLQPLTCAELRQVLGIHSRKLPTFHLHAGSQDLGIYTLVSALP